MLLKIAKGIFKAFQMINTRFDSQDDILVMVKTIPYLLSHLLQETQKLVQSNLTKIDPHLRSEFISFAELLLRVFQAFSDLHHGCHQWNERRHSSSLATQPLKHHKSIFKYFTEKP